MTGVTGGVVTAKDKARVFLQRVGSLHAKTRQKHCEVPLAQNDWVISEVLTPKDKAKAKPSPIVVKK